jgi:hypothetical protein
MKTKSLLFALITAFCLLTCNSKWKQKNNQITKISIRDVGGEMGYSLATTITKDSIIHEFYLAAKDSSKIIKVKNDSVLWQNETKALRLKEISKIKSGKSMQPMDGLDEIITIESNQKPIVIMNANRANLEYIKIKNLIEKFSNGLK